MLSGGVDWSNSNGRRSTTAPRSRTARACSGVVRRGIQPRRRRAGHRAPLCLVLAARRRVRPRRQHGRVARNGGHGHVRERVPRPHRGCRPGGEQEPRDRSGPCLCPARRCPPRVVVARGIRPQASRCGPLRCACRRALCRCVHPDAGGPVVEQWHHHVHRSDSAGEADLRLPPRPPALPHAAWPAISWVRSLTTSTSSR